MEDNRLKAAVLAACFEHEGRKTLKCSEAFRIAGEHGSELLDVAAICNEADIKICKCQLGCFP